MTIISKSALVSYSPKKMFELVDNIEAYSEFLPWCGKATEISRDEKNIEASLLISHSGLNKEFTTQNKNTPEPLGETACKVSLNLEFEFSSKIIGITLGPIFSKLANNLVDAFIKRADVIYG